MDPFDRLKPLSSLSPGQRARVAALRGRRGFQARIASMGVNVGCEIEMIRGARGSGPALLAVGSSRLAIGNGMAEKILVEVENN